MTDELQIAGTVARAAEPGDGRTIVVRMVGWDTPARTPEGYREAFVRGAFAAVDPERVTIEAQRHGGGLVGRGQALREEADAAYLDARVSRTPAGDELLALIDDGVLREASVVYKPVKTRQGSDGLQLREQVDLWRVAIVERGIHPGTGIVAVRSADSGGRDMDQIEQPAAAPADVAALTAADADALLSRAMEPMRARLQTVDERIDRALSAATLPAVREPREGEDAGSLGEWLMRAYDGAGSDLLKRALVDQITNDNPALMSGIDFITGAVGVINGGRPAITAMGGARALPDTGMSLAWPVLTPLAGRAIAVQSAQKAEVVSRAIKFTSNTAALATYAGASDVSIQLLRRSSPAYRDLFAQVMLAEYARVTESAFTAALLAQATGAVDYVIASDTTGATFTAALFAASVKVQRATGSAASVAIVAEDVFVKLGGWIKPVNPSNAIGTGTAAGLNVDVSGITIVLGNEDTAAGTVLVTNRLAAGWYEDGPNPIEATDVAKLGQNIGYYGIAAAAVPIPTGVVKLYDVP